MYWQHKQISLFWHKFFFHIYFNHTSKALIMPILIVTFDVHAWWTNGKKLLTLACTSKVYFPWADTVPLEKCRVTWCAISKLKQMRAVNSIIHLYVNQELYLVVLHGTRMPIDFWAPESILQTWALKEEAFLIRWVGTLIIMEVIKNYTKNIKTTNVFPLLLFRGTLQ